MTIHLPGARQAPTVARAALAQHNGQVGVWRIAQGRARFQPVQPGMQTAERVQIVPGLDAGDRVIAYSSKQVDDGVRVREQKLMPR